MSKEVDKGFREIAVDGGRREIADIGLVAYLLLIGQEPVDKIIAPHRVIFIFEKTDKLVKDCRKFHEGGALVEANLLLQKYYHVRGMVRTMGR